MEWIFVALAVGAPLLLFVALPATVKFTFRVADRPEIYTLLPESAPPGVYDFFNQQTPALETLGFVFAADAVIRGFIPHTTSYFRLMQNRDQGDAVMCAVIESGTGSNMRTLKYLEFNTEFSSGTEVSTLNSGQPGAFKDVPEKKIIQCPNITGASQLYDIHRRETANLEDGFTRRVLPRKGDEFSHLAESMVNDLERQAKLGLLVHDRNARAFYPTWKGAYMMSLKSVFGGKRGKD